jgi:GNAT superfamily N-acetyltransferase
MKYTFSLTDQKSEEASLVRNHLYQFNRHFTEEDQHTLLNIFIHDASGELVGGLLGETAWHGLFINILWVDEQHRHTGLGTQLMSRAEVEAKRRGCRHAYLDTFEFQAPGFYHKQGYVEWGVLDDFPPGHRRIFLKKDL